MFDVFVKVWNQYVSSIETAISYKNVNTVLSVVLFILIVLNAWQSDDPYISFRTVDNFVNGDGLVYNVGERVQSFSNPLLVLCLIPIHFIGSLIDYKTIYFTSLLFSFSHFFIVIRLLKKIAGDEKRLSVALSFVILNISIIDYFTSGLENSLNYALVLWLLYSLKKDNLVQLGFISSLLVLSRLDLSVLVLPVLVFAFIKSRKAKDRLLIFTLFTVPVCLWLLFTVVYYGSIMPTSMLAKSSFQPSLFSIFFNAIRYPYLTTKYHPLAFSMLFMLFFLILNYLKKLDWRAAYLIGVLFYLSMPFFIGGDFMAGRFQTIPALGLIALFSTLKVPKFIIYQIIGLFLIIFVGHNNSYFHQPLLKGKLQYINRGAVDEKRWYFKNTSLIVYLQKKIEANEELNHIYFREKDNSNIDSLTIHLVAGRNSFYSSSNGYNTDRIGLVDPLLARLPTIDPDEWRPGHAKKNYPKGYLNSLRSGENRIKNSAISSLYNDILLATRGENFFTKKRWLAIWRLNTGFHKIERGYEFTTNHPSLHRKTVK